jgi:3-oxoacyl-(acyl-carrier-protein) synthase
LKPIYITKSSTVAPQNSSVAPFLQPVISPVGGKLKALPPDYARYIPPMQARRMSRILKMALFAGLDCLGKSNQPPPEGIITGTSRGNLTGTEQFLKDLIEFKEEALNPTPFILSTYNVINGAIALQTGIKGYNQTFVHRGSSFELALYDAQLNLNERQQPASFLAGCYDELTEDYFIIKNKLGFWKKNFDDNSSLWQQKDSPGSIAGESASFFLLSNTPNEAIAAILGIHTFFQPKKGEIKDILTEKLKTTGIAPEETDLLVLGVNGDAEDAIAYNEVMNAFPATLPVMAFKHLCGEHETSGGFALWLLLQYLSGQPLPEEVWYRPPALQTKPRKIIYYNHFRGINHNFIFLSTETGEPYKIV